MKALLTLLKPLPMFARAKVCLFSSLFIEILISFLLMRLLSAGDVSVLLPHHGLDHCQLPPIGIHQLCIAHIIDIPSILSSSHLHHQENIRLKATRATTEQQLIGNSFKSPALALMVEQVSSSSMQTLSRSKWKEERIGKLVL